MPLASGSSMGRLTAAFCGAFLLAAAGCAGEKPQGASAKVPVYPASAKVNYKGKAVEGAIVRLLNTEPFKPGATGRTDAQGACKLMTYDADDGAPEGNYMVLITKATAPPTAPKGGATEDSSYVPPPETPAPTATQQKPELPEKYNNPARTTLKAVVTKEGPNDYTFELTD
jgi:hypothetical protein